MFTFIRDHWIAYLIGAVLAAILGFGASYVVDLLGSTPDDVRSEQIAQEKAREEGDEVADSMNDLAGEGAASADAAADAAA